MIFSDGHALRRRLPSLLPDNSMKFWFFPAAMTACLTVCGASAADEAGKSSSMGKQYEGIVKIENAAFNLDYRTPWNGARPTGGTGTGFLIGKNRFLTNAHVVSNANRLIVKTVNDAKPLTAKIDFIAHDCDLAILSLEDPSALEHVPPLTIASNLPLLDSEVVAVGYPVGGERISVTRGVVSRIDFRNYSHSGVDQHLAIQVDAAINPGNSGGPVMQDGQVVGVAFQGYSGSVAQNVGYIIPTPVVSRFLKDVEDGKYDHYADIAISDFPIENPAMRKALGLPDNGMGVMVAHVDSEGSCGAWVKKSDVLLEIDGNPIASDGFIELNGERVNMNEIVERKFAGDKIKLKIWRDKQTSEIETTLKPLSSYLMQANVYEKRPEYLIYAGLVFQPMDSNLMSSFRFGDDDIRYVYQYYGPEELYKALPQPVILTQILPDAINTHVEDMDGKLVDEINGKKITCMKDVLAAFKETPPDFVKVKLRGEGRPIVMDKNQVSAAHMRVLKKYGVGESHYIEGVEP
jgi:S1-C subfamily serine protease